MDLLGSEFLAAAALARDQHRRVDRGDLVDVGAQAHDGARDAVDVAGLAGGLAPVRRRGLGQRSHAVGVAKRMFQPQCIDRKRMEIDQVGGNQLAQRRLIQARRIEHADPARVVVLAQEAFDLGVAHAVAAVEQQADPIVLLRQDLACGGDILDHAHIPAGQLPVAGSRMRAALTRNA